jgi:hypothetical protein
MAEYPTKEDLMRRNFIAEAIAIQDASNIIAVTGTLQEAMKNARAYNKDPRDDAAVKAIFFKVYDMLGAPSEKDMYEALKSCEAMKEWQYKG